MQSQMKYLDVPPITRFRWTCEYDPRADKLRGSAEVAPAVALAFTVEMTRSRVTFRCRDVRISLERYAYIQRIHVKRSWMRVRALVVTDQGRSKNLLFLTKPKNSRRYDDVLAIAYHVMNAIAISDHQTFFERLEEEEL